MTPARRSAASISGAMSTAGPDGAVDQPDPEIPLLLGTVAFQTYAGYYLYGSPALRSLSSDADIAQDLTVSHEAHDSLPPIIELLRSVDLTFQSVPGTRTATMSRC